MDDTPMAAETAPTPVVMDLTDTIVPEPFSLGVDTLPAGEPAAYIPIRDLIHPGLAMAELPPPMPTLGRVVMFRLPLDLPRGGEERPAIITRVISGTKVNLTVLLDGPNDGALAAPFLWVGTVDYSEAPAPRTWVWPVRV